MNTKTVEINEVIYPVYADLDDAEKYNNAILNSTWNERTETEQAQLLVMATRKIDSYKYTGTKIDENQPLKFPRIMRNGTVSDDNLLINLCCQVATYYNDNGSGGSGGSSGDLLNNLKEYKLGDFQVNFKDDAKIDLTGLDDIIEDALAEWLVSNSMEIWL